MPGTCRIPPEVCTLEYDPVCACDGVTYPNECAANMNGLNIFRRGPCEAFTCETSEVCQESEYCELVGCSGLGYCNARPTTCDAEDSPVCGCNGNSYRNACLAHSAGIDFGSTGQCDD